ncbi:chaplin [Kitasatospora sp. NPDC001540]|uniref:chaplin n=1 Tax=Kitasatospora sp. NPDC001540 TaxID=3364014 RepID=UPI0036A70338
MSRTRKYFAVVALAATAVLGTAGAASASAGAEGVAVGSPGVLSGNLIQIPVHIPVNVCGNSVSLVGALNPAFGNHCANIG